MKKQETRDPVSSGEDNGDQQWVDPYVVINSHVLKAAKTISSKK